MTKEDRKGENSAEKKRKIVCEVESWEKGSDGGLLMKNRG